MEKDPYFSEWLRVKEDEAEWDFSAPGKNQRSRVALFFR